MARHPKLIRQLLVRFSLSCSQPYLLALLIGQLASLARRRTCGFGLLDRLGQGRDGMADRAIRCPLIGQQKNPNLPSVFHRQPILVRMHLDDAHLVGRHVIADVTSGYFAIRVHLHDMSQNGRPSAVRPPVTVQRGADVAANIILVTTSTLLTCRLGR
ncbi:hypothetical protein CF647_32085 [Burkholderia sp. 117]|nr:hypothetical protein CF647_32085 [Burkholderia sp. 117]